jgi:hypothetical protein
MISTIKNLRRTTPGKLQFSLGLIVLLAVAFAISGFSSVLASRDAVDKIARKAVPSIVTAQTIRVKLLELDEAATQEFLAGGSQAGLGSRQKYEAAREALGVELTQAASNISFGKDERQAIEKLMEKVQEYNGMVESARSYNRLGYPVGAAYLRLASTSVRTEMMPLVESVDKLNVTQLDSEYESYKSASGLRIGMIGITGLALIVVLFITQRFISRNMRRTFNLPLLTATAIVVALSAYSVIGLMMQRSEVTQARAQGFVSTYTWLNARGTAYDIKSDQSLYLIAMGNGAVYEDSMKAKVEALTTAVGSPASLKGYLEQDARIRVLDKGGKREQAVGLALGVGSNDAVASFSGLDSDFSARLQQASGEFYTSIALADGKTWLLDWVFALAALAVAALAYLGLNPRIREYRA